MRDPILGRIEEHARQRPNEAAIRFIRDSGAAGDWLTWDEVWVHVQHGRAVLEAAGMRRGDRLILALPTGAAHLSALLGAFAAGVTPAAVAVPAARRSSAVLEDDWQSQLDAIAPRAVVCEEPLAAGGAEVLSASAFVPTAGLASRPPSEPADPYYIQFSSGSTGRPRGLALSCTAIQSNLEGIIERVRGSRADRVVSWLPLYHDMGLFGTLLTSLYAGARLTLLDPALFTASPMLWFRLLHEERATVTSTPPSALHLCLDLLRRRPIGGLDLSALRQVICGAEHVPARIVREFAATLADARAAPAALKPVYGLAEATLAVTMPEDGAVAGIDRVDRAAFEASTGAPASSREAAALEWVSCGRPIRGVEVRIADESGAPRPEREIGAVLIRSPGLYDAVWEEGHSRARNGDWFDTGDLGYLAGGELFVTGRRKEIIIKGGRNYAPERIEEAAATVDGVSRAAAVGVYDEKRMTERIVLFVEVRNAVLRASAARDELRLGLRAALAAAGYPVDEVHLIARGELPRTTSGKLRRSLLRERCRAGAGVAVAS